MLRCCMVLLCWLGIAPLLHAQNYAVPLNAELERNIDTYICELSHRKLHDEHACVTILKKINIVDLNKGKVRKGKTVVMRHGEVVKIKSGLWPINTKGATVITAKHQYLAPGLTDMHVHFVCSNRDRLLYMINGVTSIRNLSGNVFHLNDYNFIKDTLLLSPEIFTSGPTLGGTNNAYTTTVSPEQLEEIIHRQAAQGYPFIHLSKQFSPELINAALQLAEKHQVKAALDVPLGNDLYQYLQHPGLTTLENLSAYIEENTNRIIDGNYADSTQKAGAWNCPTLIGQWNGATPKDYQAFKKRKEFDFATNHRISHWNDVCNYREFDEATHRELNSAKLKVTKALHRQKAGLLMGTESGLFNPFVVAGIAAHRELQLFQNEVGMSPLEAIKTATVNPAKVMGLEHQMGTIAVGKRAHFVILNGNPLEDVANYERIESVVIGGTILNRADIKEIKSKLEVLR